MRSVAVVLLTLLLAACSEPRIDATSKATLEASIAKVREALPDDRRNEFDALVAQARADDTADAADTSPADSAAPTPAFVSINDMTGAQAIDTLRRLADRRAGQRTIAEDAKRAEQAARESKELAALTARAKANASSLEQLRSIEVTDLRPRIRKTGVRRSYGISATIRNTLDSPLASIGFDYWVRNPDGGAMLGTGSGEFAINEALQPGESRRLEARSDGGGEALAEAVKAMDKNRQAVLAVTITGATRADGKPVVAPALTAAENKRLGRLRAGADSSASR